MNLLDIYACGFAATFLYLLIVDGRDAVRLLAAEPEAQAMTPGRRALHIVVSILIGTFLVAIFWFVAFPFVVLGWRLSR